MDKVEEQAQEFLLTFAESILGWQAVEKNLYLIFNSLVRHPNNRIPSAAFHAVLSLDARLAMISAVARLVLIDKELVTRWQSLRKRTKERFKDRNKLAHLVPTGIADSSGGMVIKLAPSVFVVSTTADDEYDVKQIRAFGESFELLRADLFDYIAAVDRHLWQQPP